MIVVIAHLADNIDRAMNDVEIRSILKIKGPRFIQQVFEILKVTPFTNDTGVIMDLQVKIVPILELLVGSRSGDPS